MFKQADGMRYVRFLRKLHEQHLFDWYMEIGCRTGRSFQNVRSKTIAVDPFFRIDRNVIGPKPELHILQKTSDEFFASGFLAALDIELSFTFLDGMHLFEFLLRDLIGTERNSHPGGIIALHDCCPYDHQMTTRILDDTPRTAWTGDVWKLIPILQKHRPDLRIQVLDCAPTGLVLLSQLDPHSTALQDSYSDIVQEWQDVTLEEYGVGKFFDSFNYASARAMLQGGFAEFAPLALPETEAAAPEWVSP